MCPEKVDVGNLGNLFVRSSIDASRQACFGRRWPQNMQKSEKIGEKGACVPLPIYDSAWYALRFDKADFLIQDPLQRRTRPSHDQGDSMVKLVVRDRETIQEAVRRFRKLVERSGIKKEMRRREYYEKPSETRRRSRLRAERRSRRTRMLAN